MDQNQTPLQAPVPPSAQPPQLEFKKNPLVTIFAPLVFLCALIGLFWYMAYLGNDGKLDKEYLIGSAVIIFVIIIPINFITKVIYKKFGQTACLVSWGILIALIFATAGYFYFDKLRVDKYNQSLYQTRY